jgi:succinate dehydrogenase/fumarate reductase flavoprotein subunit
LTEELEVDVAVVGFGAAGAASAITAADLGADVVILEKQEEDHHTPSSGMTGYGIVMTVLDVERATEYFDACSGGMIPRDVSASLARLAKELPDWLDQIGSGVKLKPLRGAQHPTLPSADALQVSLTIPPGVAEGARDGLYPGLREGVKRRGIRVLHGHRAKRILDSADGDGVAGVIAGAPDGERIVHTRKGVVLATGGFGGDEELKLNYLRAYPMYFYGNPGNTGDAIRMAQRVGAALWHMNQVIGRACMHFENNGASFTFNPTIYPIFHAIGSTLDETPQSGFIIVDRHGRRYTDEWDQAIPIKHTFNFKMFEYDATLHEYPRIPSWWVFDSRRMNAGPLTYTVSGITATPLYEWSDDNGRELAEGWIHSGPTPEAVAGAAGIEDPREVATAVADYNRSCSEGVDPLGRPQESLVPLDSPPFYCVALYPGGTSTLGGPQIDGRACVMDPFGEPIRNLYAAGEVSLPYGMLYPSSGCNLTAAVCFGRAAAESAMSEH